MAPRLFTVLQILLLGAALAIGLDALAVWRRPPLPPSVHPQPAATRAVVAHRQRPRPRYERYQAIAGRDLFHTARSTAPAPAADLRQLEPTRLDLVLWGTIAGGTRDAWAVIEEPSQRGAQQLYRTGDTVSDAVIKLILRKQVVLTVNGKDEVLLLADTANPKASAGKKRRPTVPVRAVRGQRGKIGPGPGRSAAAADDPGGRRGARGIVPAGRWRRAAEHRDVEAGRRAVRSRGRRPVRSGRARRGAAGRHPGRGRQPRPGCCASSDCATGT